jgi:hypothetical protein
MIRLVLTVALLGFLSGVNAVQAQDCRLLNVAFQPDCFRPDLSAACNPRKNASQLDLGPQIAVWLEKDGVFIDTIMVTNLTAIRGLGNRPGRWDHSSSPKFPYGRRTNVLPIWAHARGRLFPRLVMQDEQEDGLGFHELISSPDPYYCRPMSLLEMDVDAISCPTAVFNSSKGRFDPSGVFELYPPRNDLIRFTRSDCDVPRSPDTCDMSARSYSVLNDLDAVAAATPRFGETAIVTWRLPSSYAQGDYVVKVEINKEFDQNSSHTYMAFTDPRLKDSGVKTNIGQPSVLFSLPVTIGSAAHVSSTTAFAGYGDWDGRTGAVHPPDATISDSPGSGMGRLRVFKSPWESDGNLARVHAMTSECSAATECVPLPIEPLPAQPTVDFESLTATTVAISFVHSAQDGTPVDRYEIRYREGTSMTDGDFVEATPAGSVAPGSPGTTASFLVGSLKGDTVYIVGIRAHGRCQSVSSLRTATFRTPEMTFRQLSGCFIATAAHQSPLAPRVQTLRWFRDNILTQSSVGSYAVDLYYRSSPPVASVVASVSPVRAVVRGLLAPLVNVIEGFQRPLNAEMSKNSQNSDQSRQTRR